MKLIALDAIDELIFPVGSNSLTKEDPEGECRPPHMWVAGRIPLASVVAASHTAPLENHPVALLERNASVLLLSSLKGIPEAILLANDNDTERPAREAQIETVAYVRKLTFEEPIAGFDRGFAFGEVFATESPRTEDIRGHIRA